jgi:hypothetical protein
MEETNRQVPTKGRKAGFGAVVFAVCAAAMVLISRAARISPRMDYPQTSLIAKIEAVWSNCNSALGLRNQPKEEPLADKTEVVEKT